MNRAGYDGEVVGETLIVRAAARGAAVGLLELEIDTDRNRVQKGRFERGSSRQAKRAASRRRAEFI